MEAKIKQYILDGLMLYCSSNAKKKVILKNCLIEVEIPRLKEMLGQLYYAEWDISGKLWAAEILLRALNIYKNDIRLY